MDCDESTPGSSSSFDEGRDDEYTEDICLICEKDLANSATRKVGEKAAFKFISSSKRRNDFKYRAMEKRKTFIIHSSCYSNYNNIERIEKARYSSNKNLSTVRDNLKKARGFDFTNCLFCGKNQKESNDNKRSVKSKQTIDNIIDEINNNPMNESNRVLLERLLSLTNFDDIEKKGVWYHNLCMKSFYNYRMYNTVGRPVTDIMNNVLEHVIIKITESEEESEFSLRELLSDYEGEMPNITSIVHQLRSYFGNEIVINNIKNDYIICFIKTLGFSLRDDFYVNKIPNSRDEKLRICNMAGHIILQDIRARCYDTKTYKAPPTFLNNSDSALTSTLRELLNVIIKTHKKKTEENERKWDNIVTTIGHILISCVKPRSFISEILLGISTLMHRKHASRALIDTLSHLHLCSSYSETQLFQASVMKESKDIELTGDNLVQFVYDNADHNTNTIDGKGTFHAMGGIKIITPASAVVPSGTINRLKKKPTINELGSYRFLESVTFTKGKNTEWESLKVKKFDDIPNKFSVNAVDFAWLFEKSTGNIRTPGWHAYMELHTPVKEFSMSTIIPQPFSKDPPSQYGTILAVLIDAIKQTEACGQDNTFVTFDQPLWWKAYEIIKSIDPSKDPYNLRKITLRLGGFHTLMSYLGSIGFIMRGSGIEEIFGSIYAENSVQKMLMGHAFSRAMRAHILLQAALIDIIIKNCNYSDSDKNFMAKLEKTNGEDYYKLINSDDFIRIKDVFINKFEKMKENGPTAQLWLQYIYMIDIAKQFYHAERSGNWKNVVKCTELMLPFFHSSGHYLYAKSCTLHLQDMKELPLKLDPFIYDKFVNQSMFTVRRSRKFYCGNWTDMTVEQSLMRELKLPGGITHGRGFTESVAAQFLGSTVNVREVCNAMESFCNVSYASSEQHVDFRLTRILRDNSDLKILSSFLEEYDPFPVTEQVMSIYSGVVGDGKINCFKALEIGLQLQKNLIGQTFSNIKFKRSNKVLPISAINAKIKLNNDKVIDIEPLLLFQRITLNLDCKSDMKRYLHFELAPFPLSLFSIDGMRKTNKSAFCNFFKTVSEPQNNTNMSYVIDGGFLLNVVQWQRNEIVHDIIDKYTKFITANFTKNSIIVFDGYSDEGTKSAERLRRKNCAAGRKFNIDFNTKISVSQRDFFLHDSNKAQLINLFVQKLEEKGQYRSKIAVEDADLLIVTTAIKEARFEVDKNIVIVGNDTDLLVIMTQLQARSSPCNNLFFERRTTKGKSKSWEKEWFNFNSFIQRDFVEEIGLVYIFTGCDTTSCFFNHGKGKLLDMEKNKLKEIAAEFYKSPANNEVLFEKGEQLVLDIYSNKSDKKYAKKMYEEFEKTKSLNELRYDHYERCTIKKNFKLESLPPTLGAAKQHILRVYYQLQVWLGNKTIKANNYGWQKTDNGLQPVYTLDPLYPVEILTKISCSCAGNCENKCGCRKHGLKCSRLCVNCHGETCENAVQISVNENFENDEYNDESDINDVNNLIMCDDLVDLDDSINIVNTDDNAYEPPNKIQRI